MEPKLTYTWKGRYALPYESKASRMIKFCNLNAIQYNSFMKSKYLKGLSGWYEMNESIECMPLNIDFAEKDFVVCPECMQFGYHSLLHQIPGARHCFLHQGTELIHTDIDATEPLIRANLVVNNDMQRNSLKIYENTQKNLYPLCTYVVLPTNYSSGDKRLYENTKILLKTACLRCSDEDTSQKVMSIQRADINNQNRMIAGRIIQIYSGYMLEQGLEHSPENVRNCVMKENSKKPYQLSGGDASPQEWCFMSILYDEMNNNFQGQKEWSRLANIIINYRFDKLDKDDLYRVALIMASFSITNIYSMKPNFSIKINQRGGTGEECQYGIDLLNVLEPLRLLNLNDSVYNEFAEQYIFYPIIEDVYHIITEYIYGKLINHEVAINEITELPQYVVLFYQDRVEIHKCSTQKD